MFGVAYVLLPRKFESLQSELDRSLAPFKRGGEHDFPREKLAFYDETDRLARLHRSKFRFNPNGTFTDLEHDLSYGLDFSKLREHFRACRLDCFEGMLAEIEPEFETFVRRFTDYRERDSATGAYGRWLNPLGQWDWWDLGGRFNGAITGERRPADAEPIISSGPSPGRQIMENLAAALGASANDEAAQIEANLELVETLQAAARDDARRLPTAVVLPAGCCPDPYRWFDAVEWHEISPGTRAFLGAASDAKFDALVRAAYERFSDHAAAGVAYHF